MEYIYLLQHTKPDPDDKLITDLDCRSQQTFFFHYFLFYFISVDYSP